MSYIYVLESGSGHLKVGFSRSPENRLRSISTNHPHPLRLAHSKQVPDKARVAERLAHAILGGKRCKGEWFTATLAEAVDAIDRAVAMVAAGVMSYAPPPPMRNDRPRLDTSLDMSLDEFKETLKKLRLTQAELARRLYVNRATTGRWVNGTTTVPGVVIAYLKLLKYIRDRDGDMP